MILPALIIIFAIAIWPVIWSFYLSTFDLRLNDPTKREAFTSSSINMETYAGNYRGLLKTFDYEISEAKDPAFKEELSRLKDRVSGSHEQLLKDAGFNRDYEQVRNLLADFQNIPNDLMYQQLSKSNAQTMLGSFNQIADKLNQFSKEERLQRPNNIVGAMNIVKDSVIQPNFVGLANYKFFLSDLRMWNSLWNTVKFTIVSVAVEFVLGLLIAILINKNFKGRGLVRAAILVPWAIPTVVSAKMWLFMYNGEYGIIAKIFETVGFIPHMGDLLTNPFWQMFAVVFADVWKTTPFIALLILAGLQTIPDSLYEAARVDGTSKWRQFIQITLPLLKSTILVTLLFRTLDAFRVFDLIYVLLGRSQNSEVISTYAYQTMFAQTEFGAGATLSVIVFLCVAITSIVFIRILGSDLLERK